MINVYEVFERIYLSTNPMNVQRVAVRIGDKISIVFNPVEILDIDLMNIEVCMN